MFIFYFCNKKKMYFCFRRIEIKSCKKKKKRNLPNPVDSIPLFWMQTHQNMTGTDFKRREKQQQSVVVTKPHLKVGARRERDVRKNKDILTFLLRAGRGPYKYATWNIQQVCLTLQGQDAQTALMSPGD